jgi:RNA polymerase-binding protein DksA
VDLDTAKKSLRFEREKLAHQLEELGANERGELTGDVEFGDGFADAAAATAERTEVLGIVENTKHMLDDVDAALAKIADGTYGRCESCDEAIGVDRMEFRPTSRYCVGCKAKRRV